MVGEGVLHECLQHQAVEKVLVIGRRTCGVSHSKLEELLHDDFFDFSSVADKLAGYNACFFCLGVSSVGMKEDQYTRITFDITDALASQLHEIEPGLTFCYVSGAGTDGTEQGRSMWARVKGRTENHIMRMFENGYAFRPGYIHPTKGLNNTLGWYKVFAPLYPFWKAVFPKYVCTLEDLGLTMIHVAINHPDVHVINNREITDMGNAERPNRQA